MRVNTGKETHSPTVPDRIGRAASAKQVVPAGNSKLVIPLMAAAVNCPEVISAVEEETSEKLPKGLSKFTEQQQDLLGTALGRAIAHEARHLYHLPHADAGLGSEEPDLTGTTTRAHLSNPDQADLLNAIHELEKKQGSRTVVDTFAEADRDKDFPF